MKELDELLSLSPGARFRKADLHVHTPGSADFAPDEKNATPDSIVKAALDAGLDIIAVTDHNTAEWCDKVREAAVETSVVVLPGVEISTPQGHLIAIFDRDFPSEHISGLLMNAGILVMNQRPSRCKRDARALVTAFVRRKQPAVPHFLR